MDRRAKVVIGTLCILAFLIGTDLAGVMLLVVPVEHAFSADITTSQWVLNAYALTFAMVLVSGGRLGDMFGHRRLLLIGLGFYTAASIACTFAPSIGFLIGARAAQGIGVAVIWPCVIGLATTSVEKEQRGFVMGLLLGAAALGNVVAPPLAGVLASLDAWRMFFVFNTAVAVLSALLVWRLAAMRDEADRPEERIDYGGMLVLSLAVLALLYGLDVGADWGWGAWPVLVLFAAFIVLLPVFLMVERRVAEPMVPMSLLRNRQFLMAMSCSGLLSPAAFMLFLYFPQYMHKALGWPILWASIGMLPTMVALGVTNVVTGRLYERLGPRRLLFSGFSLIALGSIWTMLLPTGWGYPGLVPAMLLIGIGTGLTISPSGTATINAAGSARAGLAGGLAYMSHLMLAAIGVAAGTAILFSTSLTSLRDGLQRAGLNLSAADQRALNGRGADSRAAQAVLDKFDAADVATIKAQVSDAFVSGLHQAYWLGLAAALIGILFAFLLDEKKLEAAGEEDSG